MRPNPNLGFPAPEKPRISARALTFFPMNHDESRHFSMAVPVRARIIEKLCDTGARLRFGPVAPDTVAAAASRKCARAVRRAALVPARAICHLESF
jgi:hypothetical protein